MRRFFIDKSEIESPAPSIKGPDARHIVNVLRLKPGDKIELFNGSGMEYEAQIACITKKTVELNVLDQYK